jgi:hypothetical protein
MEKLTWNIHQEKAYEFYRRYSGWHSFAKDSLTEKTIKALADNGYLEINEFHQACFNH